MSHHPLLARQLRRAFGSASAAPASLAPLLAQVSAAYEQFDQDRRLQDHVLEVSSRELTTVNARLLAQSRHNEELLARLLQTVRRLHPHSLGDDNADLLRIAEQLESLVAARQAAEAALVAARDAADAANRAKSHFVANMSHEIRTPLNAIIGMTSLLLDRELPPVERDYVEIIRQGGEALLDTINDILDFSKIEAGRMELELIPTDPRATVEQVLDLLSAAAAKVGLELGASFAPDLPATVITDPTRLRQILVNLVGNAIKFTPSGGVGIFVTGRRENDAWTLEFVVEDTGIGIPPDRIDRLFKAFSQIDASTTRHYGGTGLGLAITARLVALLGGTIDVQSQPGEGSRFRFHLVAAACSQTVFPTSEDVSALRGRRVLVVDDIAINRRILESQLAAWGVETTLAADAQLALSRGLDPRGYDAILLDHDMPVMDGPIIARTLAQRLGGRLPPLVLLSSRGADLGAEAPLFARRLVKPVKPTELRDVLVGLLAASPRNASPAQPAGPTMIDPDFARRHPLRILVAEDVAVNRKVILLYLSRLGYHVTAVGDGQEVLEQLATEDPDLILMDMQMPVMDGLECAARIRAQPGRQTRPRIIALTANVLPEHQRAASESGMDDYLAKPLRPDALVEALRRAHAALFSRA